MKVLLLHALPFDGRMWDESVDGLLGDPLVPNLFGLGDSIEEWAAAVLDEAGSDELIVVGSSIGGSCALEIAAHAPEQVAAIVLVGAKAGVRPDPRLRDEAVKLLETEGLEAAWNRYWLPLFSDETSPVITESARSLAMQQEVSLIVNGVRAFHNRRDLSSLAASWSRPLIGISGVADVAPPPSKLRQIASGPNRSFHLVADCGHYVNLEQPAAFNQLLSDAVQTATGCR